MAANIVKMVEKPNGKNHPNGYNEYHVQFSTTSLTVANNYTNVVQIGQGPATTYLIMSDLTIPKR